MATVGQVTPGLAGMIPAIQQLIAALMALIAAITNAFVHGPGTATTSSGSAAAAEEAPLPKPRNSSKSHTGKEPTETHEVRMSLPEGIASLEQWSQTQLDFGKHKGLSYKAVYRQLPSYINWIRTHCEDSKNPEMQDFLAWIQLQDQQPQRPKMTFPNSMKTRLYVKSEGSEA